jgi:DnaJ homolog subfamily A member 5
MTERTCVFINTLQYSTYSLSSQSFFAIYRNLFSRLAHDEAQWSETTASSYPQFGTSTWPWAPASKDESFTAARTFYNFWLNFVTAKDFSWADQWELNEAPDRRVRRLMEKENKKARDDARKEYNETVKVSLRY